VCDELFGWASYLCLPPAERAPFFTASLTVDYRAPLPTNAPVLARVHVEPLDGRKLRMRARLTTVDEKTVFVDAKALFVKPKRTDELIMRVYEYGRSLLRT
jgi:acyl-CoA thioesterase FadM